MLSIIRSSWRMISSIEQEKEGPETKRQMAKEYKEELQNEIKDTCCEVTVSLLYIQTCKALKH